MKMTRAGVGVTVGIINQDAEVETYRVEVVAEELRIARWGW